MRLLLFFLLLRAAPAQTACGVASYYDRTFLIGTSDTAGDYRWSVNGNPVAQGAAPQLLLLRADGSAASTDGPSPTNSATPGTATTGGTTNSNSTSAIPPGPCGAKT